MKMVIRFMMEVYTKTFPFSLLNFQVKKILQVDLELDKFGADDIEITR